jgi:methionyl-tRNA formyltransferase
MRVIFMGTPPFAVSILDAIQQSNHELAAVVTATDKPSGRGRKLKASAVKERALELDIPVLQPEKLKNPQFIEELAAFKADVFVVVAFRMLPKEVWAMPAKGTFNLHASLLPQYRGAAPINWAIVNGEKETGLSTFFIDEKIDTGAVILQEKMDIGENETAGSLHDRMMVVGAKLVTKTLDLIQNNQVETTIQETSEDLKEAPKIFKEDLRINPNQSVVEVHNLIRGMSPFPTAWCEVKLADFEGSLKIFETRIANSEEQGAPAGKLWSEGKKIYLACADGVLEVLSLQLQGKKRLKALDFLNGQEIDENSLIF